MEGCMNIARNAKADWRNSSIIRWRSPIVEGIVFIPSVRSRFSLVSKEVCVRIINNKGRWKEQDFCESSQLFFCFFRIVKNTSYFRKRLLFRYIFWDVIIIVWVYLCVWWKRVKRFDRQNKWFNREVILQQVPRINVTNGKLCFPRNATRISKRNAKNWTSIHREKVILEQIKN